MDKVRSSANVETVVCRDLRRDQPLWMSLGFEVLPAHRPPDPSVGPLLRGTPLWSCGPLCFGTLDPAPTLHPRWFQ